MRVSAHTCGFPATNASPVVVYGTTITCRTAEIAAKNNSGLVLDHIAELPLPLEICHRPPGPGKGCTHIARHCGGQHLDRHRPLEIRVGRAKYFAHSAGADLRDDFVDAEACAG